MRPRLVPALGREQLLRRLEAVFCPKEGEYTAAQIDEMLIELCLNCPDPVAAMDAILEAPHGATAAAVLEAVLNMSARSPSSYSEEELAVDHPLRNWRVQLRTV